ncbi:thioredoxin fold domain-containing protein [Lacinutrix sp. WUR7]|uniref:thioredoxin family protein n=1 Tax=Lacinutrix sp. WUR7 TaxID=2653681 RepID=UPI00193DE83C|nr:thioredoxin family protein [Lacinutrix sp. WUR7]QRM90395.1 thioredoxin fold domain-containing protein [Lacinutrix sp. WUR7]
MKKIIAVAFILFFSVSSFAQEWLTNFNEAKTLATQNNQKIILVFQGSDWCAPCIKLDKEVWSTETFQTLAKDKFVMLQADFPKRKGNKLTPELQAHNNKLSEKYNPNGYFPFVVVLNEEGTILGNSGYEKSTPKKYFNKLNSF